MLFLSICHLILRAVDNDSDSDRDSDSNSESDRDGKLVPGSCLN